MYQSLEIIVAATLDMAIGLRGDLLYHISADLKRFKALTMGHTLIMGRKTFESLPNGALPGRRNIVLTRRPGYSAPGIEVAGNLADALAMTEGRVFVIGGASVYDEAMDAADLLHLTRIYAERPDADTRLSKLTDNWLLTECSELDTDPRSNVEYRFETYCKKGAE